MNAAIEVATPVMVREPRSRFTLIYGNRKLLTKISIGQVWQPPGATGTAGALK